MKYHVNSTLTGLLATSTRRTLLVTTAALALAGCGGSGPAEDQVYLIKFPHVTAPGTPKGQTAQRFKEQAEARFPGRVVVEIYPSTTTHCGSGSTPVSASRNSSNSASSSR